MTVVREEGCRTITRKYLKPPAHAAVFCVDEKSAIQALDPVDLAWPLSPGRAERHRSEYIRPRHPLLDAALNTATGEVLGKTANRHTSAEFVEFLSEVVAISSRRHPNWDYCLLPLPLIRLRPSKAS